MNLFLGRGGFENTRSQVNFQQLFQHDYTDFWFACQKMLEKTQFGVK